MAITVVPTVGAVVSIVTLESLTTPTEVLPAASVAVAVMVCEPLLNVEVMMVYLLPVPVPTDMAPSKIATVAPASAVPVNCGAVELVMLSVELVPESVPAVRSGADGADGRHRVDSDAQARRRD